MAVPNLPESRDLASRDVPRTADKDLPDCHAYGFGLLIGLDHKPAAEVVEIPDLAMCFALDRFKIAAADSGLGVNRVPEADFPI
ncbi:MAG: hypothetical protein V1782_11135 [Pseudomonadota bacterium]